MKTRIEPEKLIKILVFSFIGAIKPLSSHVIVEFMKKEIRVKGFAEGGYIAFYGVFNEKWFLNYQAEREYILLTSRILDILKEQFKDVPEVEFSSEDNMLKIQSLDKEYQEPLQENPPEKFSIAMKKKQIGTIPQFFNPLVQLKLGKNELADLPKGQFHYIFESSEKELMITTILGLERVFKKTLKLEETHDKKFKRVKMALNADYFQQCLSSLEGQIGLVMDKDALILTENRKKYSLTYMIRATEINQ